MAHEAPVMVCDFARLLGLCPACWRGVPWAGKEIGSVGYRVGGRVVCFGCLRRQVSVIRAAFEGER